MYKVVTYDKISFLSFMEEVIEVVSDWGEEIINKVIESLSPNGLPYDYKEQTIEEQLRDYYAIRGNTEAWITWVGDRTVEIMEGLKNAGLSPEDILSVHPMNIALHYAIAYAAEMEGHIKAGLSKLAPDRAEVDKVEMPDAVPA